LLRSLAIACGSTLAALLSVGLAGSTPGVDRGAAGDPLLALLLAAGVAALFGTPRPAARARAAVAGAIAAALVLGLHGGSLAASALAAAVGAGVAWLSPLQGIPPRRAWEGRRGASAAARF
jgi:hypothetical protein